MAIKDVCRICLAETVEKDITELSEEFKDDNIPYWDVMLFCLNIQVSPQSKFGTKLCMKCYIKIISFYKFKILAQKNDTYLMCQQNEEDSLCKPFNCDNIKCEEISNEHTDDALCELKVDDSIEMEIKNESNSEEVPSDNELLSVIKRIKYEYISVIDEDNNDTPERKVKKAKVRKRNRDMEHREKICDECGKRVVNLSEHKALHKPDNLRKRYKCKACDKTFATHSARYSHHKIKHLGLKQHCDDCGKDVICLQNHRILIHNDGTAPFECVPCGRRFISQSKRDLHILVHTKDRPFLCDKCHKTFRNKFGLMTHRRQVHDKEKTHLCQFCSKSFFKKYHLQVHLRSHSKEKPYQCPDCRKFFVSSSVLKNHRMIHSESKDYTCTLCDMAFKKPAYLRNHMVSHTKEKKFFCKYCDMPFGRSDHRLRHERNAHERHILPTAP